MGRSDLLKVESKKEKDEFPVGVVMYLLNEKDQVLMAKRSLEKRHAAGKWEVISGGIMPTEQPIEAVRREVGEELGDVTIKVEKILSAFTGKLDYGLVFVGISYLCRFLGGEIALNHEHSEYRWCELNEAIELADTEGVREELKMIKEDLGRNGQK